MLYIEALSTHERRSLFQQWIDKTKNTSIKLYGMQTYDKVARFEENIALHHLIMYNAMQPQHLKLLCTVLKDIKKEHQMSRVFLYQRFLKMWHEREIAGMTDLEREEFNEIGPIFPEVIDDMEKSIELFDRLISKLSLIFVSK